MTERKSTLEELIKLCDDSGPIDYSLIPEPERTFVYNAVEDGGRQGLKEHSGFYSIGSGIVANDDGWEFERLGPNTYKLMSPGGEVMTFSADGYFEGTVYQYCFDFHLNMKWDGDPEPISPIQILMIGRILDDACMGFDGKARYHIADDLKGYDQ
jgi:hypothetical protein